MNFPHSLPGGHVQERDDSDAQVMRHHAHIARLMKHSLEMMTYNAESEFPAHEAQTAFVIALGRAQDAAEALAKVLDPEGRRT